MTSTAFLRFCERAAARAGSLRLESVEADLDLLLEGVHAGAEGGFLFLRHLLENAPGAP